MSIANLRAGLSDLTTAIKTKRAEKKAAEEKAAKNAALKSFAESFAQGLPGQTDVGQATAGGVASGLIKPGAAMQAFVNIPKEKLVFAALQHAQSIQDPIKKREAMDVANTALELYNRTNEEQNYWKTLGGLRARGQLGQLKGQSGSMGGGGGGSSGGGRVSSQPSNGQTVEPPSSPDEPSTAKIPYTVKLSDFSQPLQKFLESDELYSNGEKTKYGKGIIGQDKWTSEDRQAFRVRLRNFMNKTVGEKTDLGAPGFESHLEDFSNEAAEQFATKGVSGFFSTSNSKDGITPKEAVITRDVPQSIVFTSKVAKGKNKGSTVSTGLKPLTTALSEVNDRTQAITSKALAPWQKKPVAKEIQPDADYYLK